jgi:Homing endonuclease associated repeat
MAERDSSHGWFGRWDRVLVTAGLTPPAGWTRERVIAALRADTTERGRAPRQSDWPSATEQRPSARTVLAMFDGSWNAALDAAGLPVSYQHGWTRERVIEALRTDARTRGRPPRMAEWLNSGPGRPTVGVVRNHFGSWNDGLRAARLDVTHELDKWTRETVLAALRRLQHELGRPPNSSELYRSPGPEYPNAAIVSRKLGSWEQASRELGWPVRRA